VARRVVRDAVLKALGMTRFENRFVPYRPKALEKFFINNAVMDWLTKGEFIFVKSVLGCALVRPVMATILRSTLAFSKQDGVVCSIERQFAYSTFGLPNEIRRDHRAGVTGLTAAFYLNAMAFRDGVRSERPSWRSDPIPRKDGYIAEFGRTPCLKHRRDSQLVRDAGLESRRLNPDAKLRRVTLFATNGPRDASSPVGFLTTDCLP